LSDNLEGRDSLGDQDIDGRIISTQWSRDEDMDWTQDTVQGWVFEFYRSRAFLDQSTIDFSRRALNMERVGQYHQYGGHRTHEQH
jgi:hypothetical protein